MVSDCDQDTAVSVPAERMVAKQQRHDLGDHKEHTVYNTRNRHMLPVLPEQKKRWDMITSFIK